MLVIELNILRKWLLVLIYLIGVMLVFLMGSLVILSFILVVFIAAIRKSAGLILTKVEAYVYSSMLMVKDIWFRLIRNLKSLN
jgi:hypothetical protein